ncbi:MAG: hypothetical protein SLAVMIC_00649 [uncultured marine phage]|uniref:Uncharacterized protein n=1 Tax=uncultured marine phage TaxID=707152 RepID=A0A8D9C9A4_9VIRU|nr:MAG: hypothetical protein SLAVMIC_00649 [uncultured marine phage]
MEFYKKYDGSVLLGPRKDKYGRICGIEVVGPNGSEPSFKYYGRNHVNKYDFEQIKGFFEVKFKNKMNVNFVGDKSISVSLPDNNILFFFHPGKDYKVSHYIDMRQGLISSCSWQTYSRYYNDNKKGKGEYILLKNNRLKYENS